MNRDKTTKPFLGARGGGGGKPKGRGGFSFSGPVFFPLCIEKPKGGASHLGCPAPTSFPASCRTGSGKLFIAHIFGIAEIGLGRISLVAAGNIPHPWWSGFCLVGYCRPFALPGPKSLWCAGNGAYDPNEQKKDHDLGGGWKGKAARSIGITRVSVFLGQACLAFVVTQLGRLCFFLHGAYSPAAGRAGR